MESLFLDDEDDYPDYNDDNNDINVLQGIEPRSPELEHDYRPFTTSTKDGLDDDNVDSAFPDSARELDDLGIDKEVVFKEKRTTVKLDAEKLLSASGLVDIKRLTRNFRFKGKNNEYRDLTRLLRCYKHWAHILFPKASFADFLAITEKAGRTNQLKVARRQWINEWKPLHLPDDEDSRNREDQDQLETQQAQRENLEMSNAHDTTDFGIVDYRGPIDEEASSELTVGGISPSRKNAHGASDSGYERSDEVGQSLETIIPPAEIPVDSVSQSHSISSPEKVTRLAEMLPFSLDDDDDLYD